MMQLMNQPQELEAVLGSVIPVVEEICDEQNRQCGNNRVDHGARARDIALYRSDPFHSSVDQSAAKKQVKHGESYVSNSTLM